MFLLSKAEGLSVLHTAAMGGNPAIVNHCLEAGVDVNTLTPTGETPLHFAIVFGSEEAAALLLKAGADPNVADGNGDPPLVTAVRRKQSEMVRMLIRHGTDVNLTGTKHATPIYYAAEHDDEEICKLLLRAGADPNITNERGYSALAVACDQQNEAAMHVLIEHGADLELEGEPDGILPVHICIMDKNRNLLRILLEAGAAPNRRSRHGLTSFDIAVRRVGAPLVAHTLLEYDFDINLASGGVKLTPLHNAITSGDMELFEKVMERHPDVEAATAAGERAIHMAVVARQPDMVEALIKRNCSVLVIDGYGNYPSVLAAQRGD